MGDMITADFNDGEGYKRVPGLWQWDRGQTLKICGLDFQNKTMEVHFAIAGSETAKTVIGEVKENHILAKIPDTLLKNGRNIWAFLYLADTKSGQTIRQIECVVNKRPKPEDYEEPEEEHILEELLEQLNKKGDRLYLEENRMQLFSGENLLSEVELPEGGGSETVEIESITNPEIDEIMKGAE